MTKFIFKINDRQIELETLPNGPLKGMFENLRATISDQLQALKWKTHHHEPIVTLGSDGHHVNLQGYGTCCREFGSTVRALINAPADWNVMTREMRYTYGQ